VEQDHREVAAVLREGQRRELDGPDEILFKRVKERSVRLVSAHRQRPDLPQLHRAGERFLSVERSKVSQLSGATVCARLTTVESGMASARAETSEPEPGPPVGEAVNALHSGPGLNPAKLQPVSCRVPAMAG
jgi:hypothetical protein